LKSIFRALWKFRHFIASSIHGELKRRFARSSLGALWFILHPLMQAAIFALVLSEVLAAKLPGVTNKAGYAIYLMAGLAAWGLFAEIVTRCTTIFIEYGGMLKKISFPRLCLPVIVGGSALLNHVLLLVAIPAVFLFFGHFPGAAWVVLPIGMFVIAAFAFGLGVLLGIFNVFVRDVGQVLTVAMQIWFWLTPIVYTAGTGALSKNLSWLAVLNPMAPLVKVYQDAMLYNTYPQWRTLLIPILVATTLFILSFVVFRRASADLVDAL
jgi:lipopolysaccharide transport system permease protein